MSDKPTKKEIRDAILILDQVASTPDVSGPNAAGRDGGMSAAAVKLASHAWYDTYTGHGLQLDAAEAAARLREGLTPFTLAWGARNV